MNREIVLLTLALGLSAATAAELPAKLKDAAPNIPVVLVQEDTGARLSPGLFHSPRLKKFVLFGGLHSSRKPHYDVEHFDLASGKWSNAYPQGAPYKSESGPTDAKPHSGERGGGFSLVDGKGASRVPLVGNYYNNSAVLMHHQHTFDPEAGTLYAMVHNRMLTMDVKTGTWSFGDTAEKKSKSNLKCHSAWGYRGFEGPGCFMKHEVLHWASMSWDPVNKEVLCVGGNAVEKGGTPGTWVWSADGKSWKRLEFGTPKLKALQKGIDELRNHSWALLSHARSRFFITENAEEAKVTLSEPCAKLKTDLETFVKELEKAKLPKIFDAGRKYSAGKISKYVAALDGIKAKLDGKIDAAFLLEFRNAHRQLECAVFGLDDQPSGRAHSQAVLDPASKKIVLFGGEGMDRSLADTWVYDCRTRQWEQRYPRVSPSPSGAHILAWLPKAKRVAMVGGYNKTGHRPFEIWTYETGANKWTLHKSVKPKPGRWGRASWKGSGVPASYGNLATIGAVNSDDVMVLVQNSRGKRNTWAIKIDAAATAAANGTAPGAKAGSMVFSREGPGYHVFVDRNFSEYKGPAFYEKKAKIKPGEMKAFFKALPTNTWVALPRPPVNAPHRDYGTTRLDPHRKQFLLWGGGHVNYYGTDVSHYSLRSGSWTAGETPDEPLQPYFGMCLKIGMSFRHRPHIQSHAYQYYDYDYTTGLMLAGKKCKTYVYDVAQRRWLWPIIDGGVSAVRATPKGALGTRNGSLVRFDRKKWTWVEIPCKSKMKPPGMSIDYTGFAYDTKRDTVWYFHKDGVRRFDIKKGEVTKVTGKSAVKGYLREVRYIPEIDRLMFHNRNKPNHDRHVFWNPEKLIWEEANIPLVGSDGKTKPKRGVAFSTGNGLMYDHLDKMIYVAGAGRGAFALKLDAKKLKFTEVK